MSVSPARPSHDLFPTCERRWEVHHTARRHRALVRGEEAAVVLGVLGYPPMTGPAGSMPADDFVARARSWQARHDPNVVRDPAAAAEVDWTPAPDAAETYLSSPADYRRAFSAFCLSSRPVVPEDRISWRVR